MNLIDSVRLSTPPVDVTNSNRKPGDSRQAFHIAVSVIIRPLAHLQHIEIPTKKAGPFLASRYTKMLKKSDNG